MLLKLASLLGFLAMVQGQESAEELVPKDCMYSFDFMFWALVGIEGYAVTDQCAYFDIAGEGDEDDVMLSWMYECSGGDMMMSVFYDTLTCPSGSGVNMTESTIFVGGSAADGVWFSCEGVANCDVKVTVRQPCVGNTDLTGVVWPAKEICIPGNDSASSYFYRCMKNLEGNEEYSVVWRDNTDCGITFSTELETALYTSGCDDDGDDSTDLEVKCNSANSLSISFAAAFALLVAALR